MNYYDGISEGYDELHMIEQLEKLVFIKQYLLQKNIEIDPNWTLLDVGCGTGISTVFFNCKKRKGIDPSNKLIEIAKKKFNSVDFEVVKAEDMDTSIVYDLVISLTATQNFENLEKGIEHMLKVGKRHIISILSLSQKLEGVKAMLLPLGFEIVNQGIDTIFIKF